jgi:hypothetical protein
MEYQNLKPLVNQKIVKAWRGYGLFISFDFGKTITKEVYNKMNQLIEVSSPEISLNVESEWAFIKDNKEIIATNSSQEDLALFKEIDNFLTENFKQNQVSIIKFDEQEDITIVSFSNSYKLEMNNKENNEEGWYILRNSDLKKIDLYKKI